MIHIQYIQHKFWEVKHVNFGNLSVLSFIYVYWNIYIEIIFLGGLIGYTCKICEKWFTSRITLSKHRLWHHKETFGLFKFNCNFCPYASDNVTNFRKHAAVHSRDRPFACNICGNRFSTQASLNIHIIIHIGENKETIVFNHV